MKFAEFFFKIRDGTEDDRKLFDYEITMRYKSKLRSNLLIKHVYPIEDITIDHDEKKIYIWIDLES